MGFRLEDVWDLSKLYEDDSIYSFRVYISKDPKSQVHKVTISGLNKEDKIVLYGDARTVRKKLSDLMDHIKVALESIVEPAKEKEEKDFPSL